MQGQPPSSPQWADTSVGTAQGIGGQMNANSHQEALFQPYSTLDEPVMETIMRDVRAVASKLKVVMLPLDRTVRIICACGV